MSPEKLAKARLFDDAFMTACFKHDNAAVEHVLRTILENPRLRVKKVVPQKYVKNPHGHSVRFDIFAEDAADGTLYVVEIQRVYTISGGKKHLRMDLETLLKRADFQYSQLSALALGENEPYKKLQSRYLIYILDEDLIGDGRPIHRMERMSRENPDVRMNDGQIIFVNGSAQCVGEDTPLSRLIHDFRQTDPELMHDSPLRDTVAYFKTTKEGRKEMVGTVQDYIDELIDTQAQALAEERAEEIAKTRAEEIAVKRVEEIAKKQVEKGQAFATIKLARQFGLDDAMILDRLRQNIAGLSSEEARRYLGEYDQSEEEAQA